MKEKGQIRLEDGCAAETQWRAPTGAGDRDAGPWEKPSRPCWQNALRTNQLAMLAGLAMEERLHLATGTLEAWAGGQLSATGWEQSPVRPCLLLDGLLHKARRFIPHPLLICPFPAMAAIATLTLNPAIDKTARVDRVVADDKLRCEAPSREPGGGGINVARVVDRLGGTARALYTSGELTGTMLEGLLDEEAITHTPVPVSDWTRENVIVSETTTDRQYRFGMPGPELTEAELDACLDALRALDPSPEYVVASGSLPPGVPEAVYARVAETAQALGARAVLDTSGAALQTAVDAGWYLLKPNLRELGQLSDAPLKTDAERIDAARSFIDRQWCEVVVISMGASGALLVTGGRAERIHSPTVPIESRVGAGDSMVGGLTVSLARGWDVESSVRFGVAAGAAAVMTPGTELCRRSDVEELFDQMGSSPLDERARG